MFGPNESIQRVAPSGTVKLADMIKGLKAKGEDVLSFAVGEPDFDTPAHIREAAKKALDEGHTHYTSSYGIPALRDAVNCKLKEENGIPCEVKNIIISPTKFCVAAAICSYIGHGDELILPNPAWVTYEALVNYAGGKNVWVPAGVDVDFEMDPDRISEHITPKTKAVLLNVPANPTGGTASPERIKGIADLAMDHDLLVITDEIYEKLTYEGKHISIASLPGMFERTITINGFSKAYAMTGWRVGYMAAPDELTSQMIKFQQHLQTCATAFAQHGAVAALTGPQEPVNAMVEEFGRRREIMVEGLNKIDGISVNRPKGAFYGFFKYDFDIPSLDLAMKLIDEAKIGFTPGSAFGSLGEGHLRFSYATSQDNIREGLRRLEEFVSKL